MALKLNLKPDERIIVNGAVIGAGRRSCELIFHNHARILQKKHILTADRIREILLDPGHGSVTPSWFYYLIQVMYITPEEAGRYMNQLADTVSLLRRERPEKDRQVGDILGLMANGELYGALRACRQAFPGCLGGAAEPEENSVAKEDTDMAHPTDVYERPPSAASDPREIEAWALMRSARRLEEARRDPGDEDELRESLRFNHILWTIFQTAVAESDCQLPREVRENVLKLSVLVDKRTFSCLGDLDVDKLDFLIDLNRNLALGLMSKAEAPGAEAPEAAATAAAG